MGGAGVSCVSDFPGRVLEMEGMILVHEKDDPAFE